jgi:hypothetical protein
LSTERRITWKYLGERKGNGKEEKVIILACVFDSLHNFYNSYSHKSSARK